MTASATAVFVVRDEADGIGIALRSAQAVCSNRLVLDTGSTDSTPDIARSLGARVVHDPWRDDFAWHKNHAADLADTDWVFCLDGDEELIDPGDLADFLRDPKAPAATVDIECVRGDETLLMPAVPRLYDRRRCRWRFPVHAVLEFHGQPFRSTARIRAHYDERTPDQARARLEVIRKHMAAEPDEPHHVMCAAMACRTLGDLDGVIDFGHRFLRMAREDRRGVMVITWVAEVELQRGNLDVAEVLVREGMRRWPGYADLHRLDVTLALADWVAAIGSVDGPYAGQASQSLAFIEQVPDVARRLRLPAAFDVSLDGEGPST